MSQNPDDAYERAAPYVQVHFPAASSSQSAASSSSSFLHQSMTSVPHPLQVVPAPPPDRPKRKRLAKACDACHKSKRRCDGTAPCSNCFFASKPCTYTDSSGRAVPAPRVAAMGPGSAGSGNNGQDPVGMGQPTGGQDAHPHAGMSLPQTPQQTYGHVGPPYYLPPPLSLPHQQQSQSPPSSHQHSYAHPAQLSNPNLYPAPLKREWNANQPASSSALLPNQQTQSRKRPRKDGFVDPEPHETFSTNIEGGHGISGSRSSTATSTAGPTLVGGYAARPSIELEPALTRELTNRTSFKLSIFRFVPFFLVCYLVSNFYPVPASVVFGGNCACASAQHLSNSTQQVRGSIESFPLFRSSIRTPAFNFTMCPSSERY